MVIRLLFIQLPDISSHLPLVKFGISWHFANYSTSMKSIRKRKRFAYFSQLCSSQCFWDVLSLSCPQTNRYSMKTLSCLRFVNTITATWAKQTTIHFTKKIKTKLKTIFMITQRTHEMSLKFAYYIFLYEWMQCKTWSKLFSTLFNLLFLLWKCV